MKEANLKNLAKGISCEDFKVLSKTIDSNENGIVEGKFIYQDIENTKKYKVNFKANTEGKLNTVDSSGIVSARSCVLWHFSKPEEIE